MTPIIFKPHDIQAILDGRKTMFRQIIGKRTSLFDGKPWPNYLHGHQYLWHDAWVDDGPSPASNSGPYLKLPVRNIEMRVNGDEITVHRVYPRLQFGNQLWVREGVCWVSRAGWRYRADNDDLTQQKESGEVSPWLSPVAMPRQASRITLTITDVKVERVQDISEADAVSEGIYPYDGMDPNCSGYFNYLTGSKDGRWIGSKASFRTLYNATHGPDAWGRNDWVAAYTFKAEVRG